MKTRENNKGGIKEMKENEKEGQGFREKGLYKEEGVQE